MNLYWGDLHNHCGISYGYGTLRNALRAAREQLDFCAVTGHAMWPDMPERQPGFAFVVDFHERGFAKLAAGWDGVLREIEDANIPGKFVTFQSYEMHSRAYGDHHILSLAGDLPLVAASSPAELIACVAPRPAIVVPHHVAYVPSYRGIIWDHHDSAISPLVEVYSKHGSGMCDEGAYPYLHSMGPRDGRSTVRRGLALGHRFGYVASTDHHAGYPGSYGDGRVAVWAKELTREALWEGLLARRTYAVTGDKIACRFAINGAPMGGALWGERRLVSVDVRGCDALDRVTVLKNNRPWQVVGAHDLQPTPSQAYKVRIEMGWGMSANAYPWEGSVITEDGEIVGVETCFRGRSVLAPSEGHDEDDEINALGNELVEHDSQHLAWRCTTFANYTTQHAATAALIVEVRGHARTSLTISANGVRTTYSLGELLDGARGHHVQAYNSEAVMLHRAVPEWALTLQRTWEDVATGAGEDVYDVEVRQANGQYAWLSPIWASA